MILQVILEGASAKRSAHSGLRHRYPQGRGGHGIFTARRCRSVARNAGTTTHAKIKQNALIFKAVCVPGHSCLCAWSASMRSTSWLRLGFLAAMVILSVMNPHRPILLIWLLGRTYERMGNPGNEDLKPYITAKDMAKWLFGTIGMAVISAALAAIMSVFIH